MIFLKTFRDLSEKLINRYVLWFRNKYAPAYGDIVANIKNVYVSDSIQNNEKYFTLFHSSSSRKIKENSLMICVGIFEHEKTFERYYILRYENEDFIMSERLIIFLKVISRVSESH